MQNQMYKPLPEGSVVDFFESAAHQNPRGIALKFRSDSYSFKELDQTINKYANYLLKQGVRKGDIVGIVLDRSPRVIIALLAVLKCGAAYLPIDPEFPEDRIKLMLEDSEAAFVLTDRAFSGNLDTRSSKHCAIEDVEAALGDTDATAPNVKVSGNDLAYLLYTSGSTGKPKGVMVSHKNLLNFLLGMKDIFHTDIHTRLLAVTTISFDIAGLEIFLPLISGGELVLADKKATKDSKVLIELLQNEDINIFQATPATYKLMLQEDWPFRESLTLLCGGEALSKTIADSLLLKCGRLFNMYGPTETTIWSTVKEITTKDTFISIGTPIRNTSVYILDENHALVPTDTEGEIFIGGDGVASGYYKRPGLTAERFIPNPFQDGGGDRIYKTGDLGKYLANGELLCLGRSDNQAKIRGYRIELEEIEHYLSKINGVKDTVVKVEGADGLEPKLIAYIIPSDLATLNGGEVTRNEVIHWRRELSKNLPDYMIPNGWVKMETFPLTPNKKVDRKALKYTEPDEDVQNTLTSSKELTALTIQLKAIWENELGIKGIEPEDNFFELGGNSLLAQKVINILKNDHEIDVPITKLYQHPTIDAFQKYLKGEEKSLRRPVKKNDQQVSDTAIAVIGMECNFPGVNTIEGFWELLKNGKETTRFFSTEELDKTIPENVKNDPSYVKARGVLEGVELFDAEFFGISPRLAELMDPQHRFFLETSRNLLEKTGYLSDKKTSVIGVFAGCGPNAYFNNNVVGHKDKIDIHSIPVLSVSDKDYISSRVSYHLNLSGPSVNVNTACSTSLVAIAQAVESLRAGQSDVAIAGGVAITVPVNSGHLYEEGSMLSADGHCRPFDADARGTVFSDGVGAVLLKRLKDAIEDGDTIYAVVKGVGINNDGGNKGSFTAPSAEGQAAAILMALDDAKINAADVSYVEAHGTATPLGDPIEIDGLKLAFGKQEKKQFCAIGSVKSNFGHLTHAAGVAGFIKTVLSLHHKQLAPSINFSRPNPHIDFANSPFVVNDQFMEWKTERKRIAGVSSLGVGGTNAHVVVEEYDGDTAAAEKKSGQGPQLICWSAQHAESLAGYAQKLHSFLLANSEVDLNQLAYTINTTRQDLPVRNFIVASNTGDLISQLAQTDVIAAAGHRLKEKNNNIVFLFPGQGNQYPNMGRDLYDNEEVYQAAVDECAEILQQIIQEDIRDIIFVDNADEVAAQKLKNTRYAQPAIFTTSYALAKLYMSWGLNPVAFAGHSVGEFVGAHLSGIFSLRDVLYIVAERGRLISTLPAGSMLSVRASEETVRKLLPPDLCIAAQNAAELCVVSGETIAIENFARKLSDEGIINKPLRTSHAFHSAMMDPIVPLLKAVIETTTLHVPKIPIMSTVTAGWLKDHEATSASYWSDHTRETVRFGQALKNIQQDLNPLFLEAGPGTSSTVFVNQNGIGPSSFSALSTATLLTGETIAVKSVLGKLWQRGVEINWNRIYKDSSYSIMHNVPTYAYHKKRFWVDPPAQQYGSQPVSVPDTTINNTTTNTFTNTMSRKHILLDKLKDTIEAASGLSVADANPNSNFAELGLDSLLLTQLTTSLKKEFSIPVTFRQLSENYDSLNKLAEFYDANLPASMFAGNSAPQPAPAASLVAHTAAAPVFNSVPQVGGDMLSLMSLQLQLLTQQVAMMQQGAVGNNTITGNGSPSMVHNTGNVVAGTAGVTPTTTEELTAEEKIELKKPFGATARIEKKVTEISADQQKYITNFIAAYNKKTAKSKEYTQKHRANMADPRVVSGFRPYTKEMVYSIVTNKSKGCYLWDIDGNKYIDALNGFGSNFLGYQPDFVKNALLQQVEDGYETGPQHVLAGEVADLVCELTGMERAGLCNTGSEAVLGAMRITRTVSGKDIIVAFAGSYHGITDEVLVRGSKKLKTYPAASGILAGNVQNMLILEYGTEESLRIIKERASEIAAVLVEPVQSRRPEFAPVSFLKELRKITAAADVALIFDEVITGFRSHLGGTQALFGIKADLATYGKVAGAGISIGIIAGSKKYMDALDGGFWEYGDDSIPEVGVTYFAGTFVRHPLALATTKAALTFLKAQGPGLQKEMNEKTDRLVARLNQITQKYRVPIYIVHFSSLWKIKFKEEYPYYELLFALMRLRNIHIWDLFPCYLTIAHTPEDIDAICVAFEESIAELCNAGFIPREASETMVSPSGSPVTIIDNSTPPVPGARLGKDRNGNPAWFAPDADNPGKYLQISLNDK